ncbi:MAG: Ig-like domain-containing protein, partial [Cellvibrionaceae bacterium]|nr:Ig-like domain-containing protein [Cellvibrionaceae bacterium]
MDNSSATGTAKLNSDTSAYKGAIVAQQGQVTINGEVAAKDSAITQGQVLQTGPDSVVLVRFPDGGLLVLGHQQSIELSPPLLALIKQSVADQGVDQSVDFERLQEGLAQGLNLEELLPAAAAGDTSPTSSGAESAVASGVRFVLTGDETIPLAGFETSTRAAAEASAEQPNQAYDSAPEAVDDFDEVKATGIATGNVVTGLDSGAQSDANDLDGSADDSGINGFAASGAVVVGVALGEDQVVIDNVGVGVELVSDKGTLTLNADGSYVYVPNRDASGSDVFSYTIVDADDDISTATLTIDIDGVPLLQVPTPINEGSDPSTWVNTVDDAGLPGGTGGIASTTGVISYLPGDGLPSVTIGGVPVIVDGQLQNTTVAGDYGTLTITSVTPTGINYTYTQDSPADHSGGQVNESFEIVIADADGDNDDDITTNLLIEILDDQPQAQDDLDAVDSSLVATGNVISGQDIAGGDSNGSDGSVDLAGADGGLNIVGVQAGAVAVASSGGVGVEVVSAKGTLVINADGSYRYQANPGAFGEDVFTYTVADADGSTDVATLVINVDEANVLEDGNEIARIFSGETARGSVLNDTFNPDGPGPALVSGFSVNGVDYNPGDTASISGVGSIRIDADGRYTFVAATNFVGAVPDIEYTVSDGAKTDDSFLNVIVSDPNQGPVSGDDSIVGQPPGTAVTINVLANDSDPDGSIDPSSLIIIGSTGAGASLTVPGQGVWSVGPAAGEISFTPEPGFSGNPTPISYQVSDNDGEPGNPASVSVVYQSGVTTPADSLVEGSSLSGSFIAQAPAGLDKLTIAGTDVPLASLQGAASTAVLLQTPLGTLTITGYDPVTGQVDYDYSHNGAYMDHSAGDPVDSITVEVYESGNPVPVANSTLAITITDTAPTAVDDINSVGEDNTLTGQTVKTNDTDGADPATITGAALGSSAGPVADNISAGGDVTLNGTYGSLT